MKKLLFMLLTNILAISSFGQKTQSEELKKTAYLDSIYYAKLVSNRTVDDFTNEINIHSPLIGSDNGTACILKTIINNVPKYYLSLSTYSSTCVVQETGLIILFSDKTKLTKSNAKIDETPTSEGFRYSVFVQLTPADLITLTSKSINKFRLYIFDGALNIREAEEFKIYTKNIQRVK